MRRSLLVFILVHVLLFTVKAQVTVPTSRMVFQRDNANHAIVPIQGTTPAPSTSIQAKATPLNGGTAVDWTTVGTVTNGVISGKLSLNAGWYQLEVRAMAGSSQTGYWTIDRVGVGEVILIAGQSNAQGNSNGPDATDDRVSCVPQVNGEIREYQLSYTFQHLDGSANCGPTNNKHFYGALGDAIVQKLNVPVLLLGGAIAGTSSDEYAKSANGDFSTPDAQNWDPQQELKPYRAIGVSLNHYIRRTGLRGILWFQGESDNGLSADAYFNNISTVIAKTRSDVGANIPWVISQTSWINGISDPNILNAQARLVSSIPNCFPGPNTDAYGAAYRNADNTHFSDSQKGLLASIWNAALTPAFFAQQPYTLQDVPPTITTGLPTPARQYAGGQLYVSYMATGPATGATYTIQLLGENGNFIANLGTAATNPIRVFLPDNLAPGRYRVQAVSSLSGNVSRPSEKFEVFDRGYSKGTGTGLTGNYYANLDLSGTPNITRVEGPLDYTWVNPLGNGMPADNRDWTARWTGQIEAPVTGTYSIKSMCDDGSRIYINNQLVIDDWTAHPWSNVVYGTIYLEQGKRYDIRVELLQRWFDAQVRIYWGIPGRSVAEYIPIDRLYPSAQPTTPQPPVLATQYAAYNFILSQNIGYINAPANFTDPAGLALTYTWSNLPTGLSASGLTLSGTPAGNAGQYTATLTATNSAGLSATASVVFNYSNPVPAGTGTGLRGDYYNNATLTGTPALSRVDGPIDFNWGTGAPDPAVNADFSVHWHGKIEAPVSGNYLIQTNDDDGAIITIDGQPVINDWTGHGATVRTGTIYLTQGQHSIDYQYVDFGGGAQATLGWLVPTTTQVVDVPKDRLYPDPLTNTPQPPVVANAPGTQNGIQGTAFSGSIPANTFSDPAGLALTYTWSGLPAGITATGLTYTGTPSTAGTFTAKLTATNSAGLAVTTTVTFAIAAQNNSGGGSTTTTTYGSPMGFLDGVDCTHAYGWAADGSQPNTSVSVDIFVNGVKAGTILANSTRTDVAAAIGGTSARGYNFTIPVQYQTGGSYTIKAFLAGSNNQLNNVYTANGCPNNAGNSTTNQPPVVANAPANYIGTKGISMSVTLDANTFTDPQGQAMTYTWQGLPTGVTGNGLTYSGIPTTVGVYQVTLTALDPAGLSTTTRFTYTVQDVSDPAQANKPPVVSNAPATQNGTVGTALSVNMPLNTITDPENQALTYTWQGLPAGLSANGLSISGTPTTAGTYNATLTAKDPGNLSVSTTVTFVIAAAANAAVTYGRPMGFVDGVDCNHVYGWAADGSQPNTSVSVDIFINGVKAGTILANSTRTDVAAAIGGTSARGYAFVVPAPFQTAGNHTYTAYLSGSNYQLNNVYTANGCPNNTGALTNQPPVVANAPASINGTVGTSLNGTLPSNTFADPEGGALSYSWSGLPAGMTASGLTYSGTPSTAGNYNATLTATDNGNLSVSTTVTFVIAVQNNSGGGSTTTTTYGSPTGFLDGVDCSHAYGWAADRSKPNESVSVDIYMNGVKAGTILANGSRPDVAAAIGGTSARGYNFYFPAGKLTGGSYTITAYLAGSTNQLFNTYTATGCPSGGRIASAETINKSWNVYPNPVAAGNTLHVANADIDPFKTYSVSIVTQAGQRQPIDASQYTVSAGMMDIQLPILNDGLYILTIASENGVHTHKLIVGATR